MAKGNTWGFEDESEDIVFDEPMKGTTTDKFGPKSFNPESITVVWGEEVFSPVQYNSFRVGPFTYTVTQRFGESLEKAVKRANDFLEKHADKMFVAKRNAYLARLKTVRDAVKTDKEIQTR